MAVWTCLSYNKNPYSLSVVLNTNLTGQALVCLKGSTVLSDLLTQHEAINYLTLSGLGGKAFLPRVLTSKGRLQSDGPFSTLGFYIYCK